ncbi:MAG: hypothetical protein H6715_03040 [Myxococcales bacterium]|nr:hypothetical protein [Myxococcales bacterium]
MPVKASAYSMLSPDLAMPPAYILEYENDGLPKMDEKGNLLLKWVENTFELFMPTDESTVNGFMADSYFRYANSVLLPEEFKKVPFSDMNWHMIAAGVEAVDPPHAGTSG